VAQAGPLQRQVAVERRLLAWGRVGQAVRARLREEEVGPLNRLEWALRAEPEGRRQLEPGRVAEVVAQCPFHALYCRNNEKATATAGLVWELFTTPTLWHPK
jgi:hypothetical protein